MNKIEHELKWSIESNYLDGFFFNGKDECIRELNVEAAAKKCFESIEKYSVGFMLWKERNGYSRAGELDTWFKGMGNKIANSTEELFKIYIEQL